MSLVFKSLFSSNVTLNIEDKSLKYQGTYRLQENLISDYSNFKFHGDMLYQKTKATQLRKKGNNEEGVVVELNSTHLGINTDSINNDFPLSKDRWLVYWGTKHVPKDDNLGIQDEKGNESSSHHPWKQAIVLPSFTNKNMVASYKNFSINEIAMIYDDEFFYWFSESIRFKTLYIDFCRSNSFLYQNISLQFCDQSITSSYNNSNWFISPSGRYFPLFVRDDKDDQKSALTLEINEIILDPYTKQFEIKNKRKIANVDQTYHEQDNKCRETGKWFDMFISDQAEILAINISKNEVMYEGINIFDHVQSKLGKNPLNDEFNELKDLNYCIKNGGFIFHNKQEVYFLRVSSLLDIQPTLIRLDLHIVEPSTTIEKVHSNLDPSMVVIEIVDSTSRFFIVWDVIADKEIYYFRLEEKCLFMTGRNTKIGYLILENGYIVDLDQQTIDFNFRTDGRLFEKTGIYKGLMMFESK